MKGLSIIFAIICVVVSISSDISAEISSADVYKVGVNDVIEINVLDHSNLRTMAIVASDGSITFPYVGTVIVKDMTISDIEKEITQRLSEGYIKYPVVSVALSRSLSKKIYIFSEAGRSTEVPYEEGMTILRALSVAGGVPGNSLYGIINLRRRQDSNAVIKDQEINLKAIIEGNKKKDVLLKPGDILIVKQNISFYMHGEIYKPGQYVLKDGMTVVRALSLSGGIRRSGLYGKIKVRRKHSSKPGYKDIEINLKGIVEGSEKDEMLLQADDIVIVEQNKTFSVQGEVASPGRFDLERDMTVLKALLEGGGANNYGRYGKLRVRRKQEGDSVKYSDIAETYLNNGIIESNEIENMLLQSDDMVIVEKNSTFLIQGEAAKSGRFILEKDMTVLGALLEAGGVNNNGRFGKIKIRRKKEGEFVEYTDLAESSLIDGVIESKKVEGILIQPDDILFIEKSKTFFVYGEVNKTGEFLLEENMTVFKAIINSGGFTKWGSANNVKILRKTEIASEFTSIKIDIEDVIEGDATKDVILKEGDIVVVSTGIF